MFELKDNYVYSPNGKRIGEVYQEIDGFYVFSFLNETRGCFPQEFFSFVARTLLELNKPIQAYMVRLNP